MTQVWGMTDIGLVRRENQDAYGIHTGAGPDRAVCVVCDGMGGVNGGGVASRIAVDTYLREMADALPRLASEESVRQASAASAAAANDAIRAAVVENPAYQGMGTTLVSAVVLGEAAVISNIGDSRAYHIRPGQISQISKDHSWVAALVDRGDITEDEARVHPKRNYITRALGPEPSARCDSYTVSLAAGEYILLCTDGLVSTVTDQEMYQEIQEACDPDSALDRLLAISKSRGAADNVTAVLLRRC